MIGGITCFDSLGQQSVIETGWTLCAACDIVSTPALGKTCVGSVGNVVHVKQECERVMVWHHQPNV